MDVHFVFSDETGAYKPFPSSTFSKNHPVYVRVALGMSAEEWALIRWLFNQIVQDHGLPNRSELKWSHIGSIRSHERSGQPIKPEKDYAPLAKFGSEALLDFVREVLAYFQALNTSWIIYTFTFNQPSNRHGVDSLMKMHVQDIMQRTQLHLKTLDALGVLFFDPVGEKQDKKTRENYGSILRGDRFVSDYKNIKDSLGFELSHQSFGIRLADYAAGVFRGWLLKFKPSDELFEDYLWPRVRKKDTGWAPGWGIIDVPKRREWRNEIVRRTNSIGKESTS